MKTKLNVVQVQGTQANYALFTLNTNASKRFSITFHRSLRPIGRFWAVLFLMAISTISMKAQGGVNRSVSNYGFEISAPEGTLDSGESATITILVGSSSTPVNDALGFEIDLELGDHAIMPQASNVSYDGSWFFTGSPPYNDQFSTNSVEHSVTVSGTQSPAVSGYGTLFKIELTANVDNVEASSLVQDGGGMILVDEAGFKTAPSILEKEKPDFELYPNPSSDVVNFRWEGSQPEAVYIYDLQGKQVANLNPSEIQNGSYSIGDLLDGIYQVIVQGRDGIRKIKKLFKR